MRDKAKPDHYPKAVSREDAEVGKRLRLRRIELDLSQTDIGQVIGVSFQQVQKYERGQNRLSAGRIAKLAGALNVPKSFFYDESAVPVDFSSVLVGDKKLGVRLAKAFSRIENIQLKRQILAMVETIAEDQ